MMKKSAQPVEGGRCTYKVEVYAPAERADKLPYIFLLYLYIVLCGFYKLSNKPPNWLRTNHLIYTYELLYGLSSYPFRCKGFLLSTLKEERPRERYGRWKYGL